jgi:putative endonuclease
MSDYTFLKLKNEVVVSSRSNLLGKLGEELAYQFLIRHGFRPVCANFKVPVGRNRHGATITGEIDLIALDGSILCFIEVKTRSSAEFASPLSAVDLRKQRQITRTARIYRKIFGLTDISFRYDVVSIILEKKMPPKIEIVKGFWTESKFRQKLWREDIW